MLRVPYGGACQCVWHSTTAVARVGVSANDGPDDDDAADPANDGAVAAGGGNGGAAALPCLDCQETPARHPY